MFRAKLADKWDDYLEMAKLQTRRNCSQKSSWGILINALIKSGRTKEAIDALNEMERHGAVFDTLSSAEKYIKPLIGTKEFNSSDYGKLYMTRLAAMQARHERAIKKFNALRAEERPPNDYLIKTDCPYDCCSPGKWTAKAYNMSLLDNPRGDQVIGSIAKGMTVKVISGESHTRTQPLVYISSSGEVPEGEIFFSIGGGSEGFGGKWYRGKKFGEHYDIPQPDCLVPGESCEVEYVLPPIEDSYEWWGLVETENGEIGWTDDVSYFDIPTEECPGG